MTPENFCYWLKGYFELKDPSNKSIDAEQVKVIQDHLELVFKKETPDRTCQLLDYSTIMGSC